MPSNVDEIRNEMLMRVATATENICQLLIAQNLLLTSSLTALQSIDISLKNFGEAINVNIENTYLIEDEAVISSQEEY